MNPDSTRTRPIVDPDVPEWMFPPGFPQVVVNVPNNLGDWSVYRITDAAPTNEVERAFARTLLTLALQLLDDTESARANGVGR